MNDESGGSRDPRRRSRFQRAGMVAAVLASLALLAAACSGSSSSATAAETTLQKAVAYSHCMRSHGVPNYPDPNSQGNIVITPANHLTQGSPQFQSANKACEHLFPSAPITAAEQQKIIPLMLKFTACMRSHGITNFPDPIVDSQGIGFNPHGLDIHSPQFQAAQQACQKYTRAAGKYIPPGP